jgi:hypothetical protein
MYKQEIRSLIKNLLPKYSQGAEYHDMVVDRAIEKVVNQLYLESFLRDPLSLQRYVKRYGGTVAIPVVYDAVASIYYSNFPTGVMPVPIPDKASGVRRISNVTQGGITFYPIDQREMELITSGSFYRNVSTKIGYCVTQDRVEYLSMTVAIAALGVRMDILVPFSDYADTDEILIPETINPQGETLGFAERVLTILGVIRPQETKDDNVTTIQTGKQ